METTLLIWLFYLSSFYAFIPGLISRIFGFRAFRKGKSETEFALTFDDGPDPRYTAMLLDLLKRYEAKATFFVVGSHAHQHPELLKRMQAEGHSIGIHNYVHRTNWLMRPGSVRKQVNRTNEVIERVTGQRATYYRPPWGIVNLFDLVGRNELKIVLWSGIFGDWRKRLGEERLLKRMRRKMRGGEVLVLHDCGATLGANDKAPENMLRALERFLQEAYGKGLQSVTVERLMAATKKARGKEMGKISPMKKMLVGAWLIYERGFRFVFRLREAENAPLYHFRQTRYSGRPLELGNGDTLVKGDSIVELHFDNKMLFEFGSRSRSAVQLAIMMIRGTEQSFPGIADYIRRDPELSRAKAVYAVSMVNRGPEQFGFRVHDLPDGLFARATRLYLKLLLWVIHPSGGARLQEQSDFLVPKVMVMPMHTMLTRDFKADKRKNRRKADTSAQSAPEREPVSVPAEAPEAVQPESSVSAIGQSGEAAGAAVR
ncbi:polysaccharide deacetylase family protein [Saccharibacillus sp. CPCC 101409]|uniref:polysaccharide deacetylase family protein n=1 Tax=Saccharibacillus sp. CPCC 101409 TaxID=3058041 RepID=UPI002674100D|nr:polysaccharide deacetylase family protein [Saccharibacillus sp. CPCC 101409]MDO3409040.1 polysaccharide deacetylase family protein [Saccharibacillus sp. CPCC 101409]